MENKRCSGLRQGRRTIWEGGEVFWVTKVYLSIGLMGYRGKITSHSFRAGIVNEMVDEYSEEEIQGVGRWSSDAYLHYIKKPMAKRALIARRIGKGLKRL